MHMSALFARLSLRTGGVRIIGGNGGPASFSQLGPVAKAKPRIYYCYDVAVTRKRIHSPNLRTAMADGAEPIKRDLQNGIQRSYGTEAVVPGRKREFFLKGPVGLCLTCFRLAARASLGGS